MTKMTKEGEFHLQKQMLKTRWALSKPSDQREELRVWMAKTLYTVNEMTG